MAAIIMNHSHCFICPFVRIQAGSLAQDSICLGDIPVHSQFSRLLCLTNTSRTDTIYYKWVMDNQQVLSGVCADCEYVVSLLTLGRY